MSKRKSRGALYFERKTFRLKPRMSLYNLWAACLHNALRITEILQRQYVQSNTVGEKRKCEDSLPGKIAR